MPHLEWADKIKYLGVYCVCNTALTECRHTFQLQVTLDNFKVVLSVIGKGSREMCTLHLNKVYCLPWLRSYERQLNSAVVFVCCSQPIRSWILV